MVHEYTEEKTINLGGEDYVDPSEEVLGTALDIRNTVTDDGAIPAGATSYKITNLGPAADGLNLNVMTINGIAVPVITRFKGGTAPEGTRYESIPYLTNGNTLEIEYTIIT